MRPTRCTGQTGNDRDNPPPERRRRAAARPLPGPARRSPGPLTTTVATPPPGQRRPGPATGRTGRRRRTGVPSPRPPPCPPPLRGEGNPHLGVGVHDGELGLAEPVLDQVRPLPHLPERNAAAQPADQLGLRGGELEDLT